MSQAPQFVRVSAGEPFRYPMVHEGEGTLVSVMPGDQAPDIVVLAKLDNPTAAEIRTTWYPRSNARY